VNLCGDCIFRIFCFGFLHPGFLLISKKSKKVFKNPLTYQNSGYIIIVLTHQRPNGRPFIQVTAL
jgi:hypothetical protein